jgi:signal transduction histidine kinase
VRFPLTAFDRGRWTLALLLLVGVLAPTVCVLWFLNVAVDNQRDASRRKLADAYRGQLTLLRDRTESYWQGRAEDLEREAREGAAPAVFARLVSRGLADSAICLNGDGSPAYPAMVAAGGETPSDRADWRAAQTLETWRGPAEAAPAYEAIAKAEPDSSVAARAAQAQIRCLVRAGDRNAALRAIERNFTAGRLIRGVDPTGRLIAPDEQLLALHLMGAGDARYAATLRRLHDLVNDYGAPLPSAQRLFLMGEVRAVAPQVEFPMYAAERLAAEWLEAGRARPGEAALEASGIPEVWRMTAPGGRVVALYRTETVASAFRKLSSSLKVAVALRPPGRAGSSLPHLADQSLAAGPALPGWQLALSLGDERLDEVTRQQAVSYVWIALLAIGVVAVTAVFAGQAFQRQWRLTRLKTDLVAAVSHELKTPLASMRLLVDALLDDERPDETKTREYLELIARENQRLSRLIENFLTFSRLERNRRRFEFRATRPEAVVQAALDAARERTGAPDCRFEVHVSPGLPLIRADEDALVTALLNLLDNALKYTPGEKRICIKAFERRGRVVFAVEDNGIGIAPREQKKIFRRFYQVDRRLAREAGGCGLGLSIVEFIVRAHGGVVEVASEPGKGSQFSVAIPVAGVKGVAA